MLRIPAALQKFIDLLTLGQPVQPVLAREAAQQFESGHVCRNCESQLLRLPGGGYHWCPTCGAETHGPVVDVCVCGSHIGKHDAQMRCHPAADWIQEVNPLIRRKVRVVNKPQPTMAPTKFKSSKHELFDGEDE